MRHIDPDWSRITITFTGPGTAVQPASKPLSKPLSKPPSKPPSKQLSKPLGAGAQQDVVGALQRLHQLGGASTAGGPARRKADDDEQHEQPGAQHARPYSRG